MVNKSFQLLWNKTTLLVLLIISNFLWGTYYFKDRVSYKSQIEVLEGAYKHILEDNSLQIQNSERTIDSLAQIPKASTDEKEKELVIKYKKIYNISTTNDSSTQQSLKSILSEPRKFSQESSN